jgi:hypothetical protein
MKRFHLALAVADLDASIADYSARLGQPPQVVVEGVYALWRTEQLNFSINLQRERAGKLCRMGFVDDETRESTRDTDVNGIAWERFSTLAHDLRVATAYGVPRYAPPEDELIRN